MSAQWPFAFVQAPMAGVSTVELAAAVLGAGGLGSLALGALDVAGARAAMARLRGQSDRPFAVNLFCHARPRRDAAREAAWLARLGPAFGRFGATPPAALDEGYASFRGHQAMLAALVEARPAVVSFHFGLPDAAQISALRTTGARLIASATSIDEGRAIVAAGLDAIVAQGWEAGGHRGRFDPEAGDDRLATLPLVAALKGLGLPVIAAGGIMDRADARAALAAGAAGVQCGTAFLLAPEAATSAPHRASLAGTQTMMTRAISGREARGMANLWRGIEGADAPDYPVAYAAGKALNAAALVAGESGFGAFWAGTGSARAVARPAAETIAAIRP